MSESNVPTAVEIVHVPAVQILEGHRIETNVQQSNVVIYISIFAVVILLYIILTVLKFIK